MGPEQPQVHGLWLQGAQDNAKRAGLRPARSCSVRLGAGIGAWVGGNQHRTGALLRPVLGQHAKAAGDFLISLQQTAEIAAEAVLVQLVGGLQVPQAAAVRADLVREHDAHLIVFPQATELDLEVYQADANA